METVKEILVPVKKRWRFRKLFVAFSEYMNFKETQQFPKIVHQIFRYKILSHTILFKSDIMQI